MTFVRTSCPSWFAFRFAPLLVCALLVVAGFASDPPPIRPGPTYAADIAKYRAWRVNDDKTSWATLAGLYWLKPGANTFGSAKDNAMTLPPTGPAHAGSFEFNNGEVTVRLAPGVHGLVDGKPATTARMLSDKEGENKKPTPLEIGKLQIKVIQRGKRVGIRLKDLASPNLKSFRAPDWYPVDPAYRVTARWEPGDGKKKIVVPNVLGDATEVPVSGTAHFKLNGKEFAISPVEGDPNKEVMFVISDATTNKETYPAGRMIDAGPVQNGEIVIDFNTAYNPPCAVTPYATCPIAPKENRLPIPVRAGAKYDLKHPHAGPVFVAP